MTDVSVNLRLRFSERCVMTDGERCASSADVEAVLRAAINQAEDVPHRLAVVVAWVDGSTFLARIELERDRDSSWTADVIELCTRLERAPEVRELLGIAHLARSRIRLAVAQEHITATLARATALGRRLRRLPPPKH